MLTSQHFALTREKLIFTGGGYEQTAKAFPQPVKGIVKTVD
jgi:hypothetical protein